MKRFICILAGTFLWASPALAVGCFVTQSTVDFVEIDRGGTLFRVNQADLVNGADALKSADLIDRLTALIQFRQSRSELPIDDPDRFTDPGGPDAETGTAGLGLGEKLYWSDIDGVPTPGNPLTGTHLTANGDCVIDNAPLIDGTFVLTIRNARDCFQDPTFPSCLTP